MHKTCAERTKTFLIHRTIDEYTFFAISRHTGVCGGIYYEGIYMVKVILTEIYMLEHFL